jgi:hypothetical protein
MDSAISAEDEPVIPEVTSIGAVKAAELSEKISLFPEYAEQVLSYLGRQGLSLEDLSIEHAEKIESRIVKLQDESTVEVSHG